MKPTLLAEPCDPAIEPIVIGHTEEESLTARIRALFDADQAARQTRQIDWKVVARQDTERRREVMGYLSQGALATPASLYHAAFIFQHGNCSEHYDLAHRLADHAVQMGYTRARWIYAASRDRALMSRGLPQHFGTQYIAIGDGPLELYDYDPTTTDEERARYDVPPLRELLRRAQKGR